MILNFGGLTCNSLMVYRLRSARYGQQNRIELTDLSAAKDPKDQGYELRLIRVKARLR